MTYGYNASFKNFTAQQDIRSISAKMLTELVDLRTTEEVCTSLHQGTTSFSLNHEILISHQGNAETNRFSLS